MELFVQLCVCHKNKLGLGRALEQSSPIPAHKVLRVEREATPELLLRGRLVPRNEVLASLAPRFAGVHRQLAMLADRDLAPLFKGGELSPRARQTLLQLEAMQAGESKESALSYLQIKIASYILVLLHVDTDSQRFPESCSFVQQSCPALVHSATALLRSLCAM